MLDEYLDPPSKASDTMRSKLRHSEVISVELVERESMYHDRGVITVTEQNRLYDRDVYSYYYEPIRVNTYRIAGKLVLGDIVFDSELVEAYGRELVEQLVEKAKRVWRLQLSPVRRSREERYPDVELVLEFKDDKVKVDIYVKYPKG